MIKKTLAILFFLIVLMVLSLWFSGEFGGTMAGQRSEISPNMIEKNKKLPGEHKKIPTH